MRGKHAKESRISRLFKRKENKRLKTKKSGSVKTVHKNPVEKNKTVESNNSEVIRNKFIEEIDLTEDNNNITKHERQMIENSIKVTYKKPQDKKKAINKKNIKSKNKKQVKTDEVAESNLSKATKKRRKRRKIRKALFVVLLLLIIIVAILYMVVKSKLGKMNYININEGLIEVNEGIKQSLDNYRNIALLGVDSTVDDYGMGNRTDCIIIASMNKKTNEIKMFSVYRDTYVEIPGHGLDKINHAYDKGGAELTMSTLNTNLDLNITEFVAVNFDAVAECVDSLGGIEINIAKDELPLINAHVEDTAKRMGTTEKNKITKEGMQTLTGIQAVGYSRIRKTEGLDYRRTERMRTVILAMLNKAKSKSLFELNNVLTKVLPEVTTNITANEMIAMLPQLTSFTITENIGWPYETKPFEETGPWYGVPVTLESNVSRLHKEIFEQEGYSSTQKLKEISERIIKKTGYSL